MKRRTEFIFASTLMLLMPSSALAQYDVDNQQCIYPSHRCTLLPTTAERIDLKSNSQAESMASTLVVLDGKISKSRKSAKHPQALSLKFTEDQASRTLLPGSTFTIELENELSSKDAAIGDKVGAHLIQDLRIGDQLLASRGAKIEGSVSNVIKARKGMKKSSKVKGHFRNSNGGIQIDFNKLVSNHGTAYVISAAPASGSDVQKLSGAEQKMEVNKHNEVGVPYHAKKYEAISFAITTGSIAAGPFGFAAAPALCAFIGGVCPAYGLGRPSKPGEKHTRIKGALMGALRGSPGGFITSGFFVEGLEAKVSTGDQLILQLSQPLTVPLQVEKISSANQ